ncbi:MAG: 3'-5' exoribonuclease [Desulfobacterales bacterium]|jgi:DNA polymerase-3 subunit epsilon|nr:3'-5' exoribonuclease [Desulfobacterales bacterium]
MRYAVLDVETTGLSPGIGDRIIEIGAVAIQERTIVAEFESLIYVKKRIPLLVQNIHGITNEMLIGKPEPEEVFPQFREFIGDSTLVAHNAQFDIRFLRYEFERLGLKLSNRHLCTLEMSRELFPELENHKLYTVAKHVLVGVPENMHLHRALDDARLTAMIWMEMVKR